MTEAVRGQRHGCRLLVAGPGYGKTTRLESGDGGEPVVYRRAADLMAGIDPAALAPGGARTGRLAVDDLGLLDTPDRDRLATALRALPPGVRLSVAVHEPLARSTLAALPAPVTERTAADLALPADAVTVVLRDEYGVADTDLARHVTELTAGWPALVTFAGEALAGSAIGRRDLLGALTAPGTPAAAWLDERVLGPLPDAVAELLDRLAGLEPITLGLGAHLAAAGELGRPDRVLPGLRWLIHTGLVAPARWPDGDAADPAYRVVPVLASRLDRLRRLHGDAPAGAARDRVAAAWYREHGHPLAAAHALRRAGDLAGCVRLIEAAGADMVAADAPAAARLLGVVPERSDRLTLLLGDAQRIGGDAAAATATFAPLLERAARTGDWPAGLVWRAAMVHYMRSDYRSALAVCDRHTPPDGPPGVDDALALACRASTLAMLGDPTAAQAAAQALTVAESAAHPPRPTDPASRPLGPADPGARPLGPADPGARPLGPVDPGARTPAAEARTGGDRALAAAHLAVALTEAGGRRDRHLADARAAAERAGDLALLARVLLNQTVGLAREARYAAALDVAARAVRAAERGGPPGMRVVTLVNEGHALTMVGRFEEAALRFDRAVQLSRRAALNRTAMGLAGSAELHRLRGRHEQSRALFEEAVDLARADDDRQVLVSALAKLTRVALAGRGPDLEAARAAADEAERAAGPRLAPVAMVARGYVALAEGDRDAAARRAASAVAAARATRRVDCLAEALELAGAASTDAAVAAEAFEEAEAIWRRGGAEVAADLVLVRLGELAGAGAEQRAAGRAAGRRLQARGVPAVGVPAPDGVDDGVRIRVLGRFEVLVGGEPVPLAAWRSRQARSLLKILVARRGRPVPRGELSETLWPDDDARRTAHRLSVLLSAVRAALDPAHAWPVDRYVRADAIGIRLDRDHVLVDAEDLIRDSELAARLLREGRTGRAREILAEIEGRYAGDAFDDEPYADWAHGLRDEVRAAGLRALRQLATLSVDAGDLDQAVSLLTRLLGADPYDESVHRLLVTALVRGGRHGEARRAFDRWSAAMRAIDVPAPAADVLRHPVSTPAGRRSPVRSTSPFRG
ncbi:BTAD domain-containing putative transcriptional regulator [Plantactinospora siamensis]|uniref:BTAD domain-containing putative transcriptional regulator n=1 Tax=Plantactinospora siamensis TaxID=555372 RepID=A0ABV6P1P9_9ACTN